MYKEFKHFKFQKPLYHKFINVLERFEFKNPKEPFIKLMPSIRYFRYGPEDLQRKLAAPDKALISLSLRCGLVLSLQVYVLPEGFQELAHSSYGVLSTISRRLDKSSRGRIGLARQNAENVYK